MHVGIRKNSNSLELHVCKRNGGGAKPLEETLQTATRVPPSKESDLMTLSHPNFAVRNPWMNIALPTEWSDRLRTQKENNLGKTLRSKVKKLPKHNETRPTQLRVPRTNQWTTVATRTQHTESHQLNPSRHADWFPAVQFKKKRNRRSLARDKACWTRGSLALRVLATRRCALVCANSATERPHTRNNLVVNAGQE